MRILWRGSVNSGVKWSFWLLSQGWGQGRCEELSIITGGDRCKWDQGDFLELFRQLCMDCLNPVTEVTGRSGRELQKNWPWKNILRTDVIAYLDGELKGKFVVSEGLNLPNHWILQYGKPHYQASLSRSLAITRLHGEIKAQNERLTICTVIPIKHLSACCYWASLFPTLMQNEIADLTKDAKRQRVFESSGRKLP